jgi:sarcosine oxidase
MARIPDVAVIGAGVFGAWTAYWLCKAGRNVVLVDAYGAGNSRSSSGGESRIIRFGYGEDELYSRWSMRALPMWQQLAEDSGENIFYPTGVLWLAREGDAYTRSSLTCLRSLGAKVEERWPQIAVDDVAWAMYEPESGALMARHAVQTVMTRAESRGVSYARARVEPGDLSGKVASVPTRDGGTLKAGAFVFACGPWLPQVFPKLLGKRMFITRQEIFFFGTNAGSLEFSYPHLPTWLCHADDAYGMPDLEHRGCKISFDKHGPKFDPESDSRMVSPQSAAPVRDYLARRFPRLQGAPVVETRVCQYENTSSGDFLIDRHPDCENVWIVGGGSGHGFKHGPVVGEYCAALVRGKGKPEPRFALAGKAETQRRAVY